MSAFKMITYRSMHGSKKNGFTLVETLCALLCACIISMLCVAFLKMSVTLIDRRWSHQSQMAILQLRQMASMATYINVKEDDLHMRVNAKDLVVTYDRNRLVRQEGYQILMEDIIEAYFYEENEAVFLAYKDQAQSYIVQIY